MSKKDEIDKIIKDSFEKARQLNSQNYWAIAKIAWVIIAIVIIFYRVVFGE